jgi:hypothetical protein
MNDFKHVYGDHLVAKIYSKKELIDAMMNRLQVVDRKIMTDTFNCLFSFVRDIEEQKDELTIVAKFDESRDMFEIKRNPDGDYYEEMSKHLPTHPDDPKFIEENPILLKTDDPEEEDCLEVIHEQFKTEVSHDWLKPEMVSRAIEKALNSEPDESIIDSASILMDGIVVEDSGNLKFEDSDKNRFIEIALAPMTPDQKLKFDITRSFS